MLQRVKGVLFHKVPSGRQGTLGMDRLLTGGQAKLLGGYRTGKRQKHQEVWFQCKFVYSAGKQSFCKTNVSAIGNLCETLPPPSGSLLPRPWDRVINCVIFGGKGKFSDRLCDLTSLSVVVDESLRRSSVLTEWLDLHWWDSDPPRNCWKA